MEMIDFKKSEVIQRIGHWVLFENIISIIILGMGFYQIHRLGEGNIFRGIENLWKTDIYWAYLLGIGIIIFRVILLSNLRSSIESPAE